jgi:hypothetical protein
LSEYTIFWVVYDIIRSYDLENNHENLEEEGDNPFDYFLQSTACAIRINFHTNTAGKTKPIFIWNRYMIHNIDLRANWDQI